MLTYDVENENKKDDISVQRHGLAVMKFLRQNEYHFYRLNAFDEKNIKKLDHLLELLHKWIFVEEIFCDKTPLDPKAEPFNHQMSVVISRSTDFGERFIAAKT